MKTEAGVAWEGGGGPSARLEQVAAKKNKNCNVLLIALLAKIQGVNETKNLKILIQVIRCFKFVYPSPIF